MFDLVDRARTYASRRALDLAPQLIDSISLTKWGRIRRALHERSITTVYALDSNVVIKNPFAWSIVTGNEIPADSGGRLSELVRSLQIDFSRDPNAVVLCSTVAEELDNVKGNKRKSVFVRACATATLRNLERMATRGAKSGESAYSGISLPNNGLYFDVDYRTRFVKGLVNDPFDSDEVNGDTKIVATVRAVQKKLGDIARVVFVSDDANARRKAIRLGIPAEEFRYEQVKDVQRLYTGVTRVSVDPQTLVKFKQARSLPASCIPDEVLAALRPNEAVFLDSDTKLGTQVGFIQDETLVRLPHYWGIIGKDCKSNESPIYHPFNPNLNEADKGTSFSPHQKALISLIRNPEVHCVSVIGVAGTGKTLCSIIAGIQMIKERKFERIIYFRPLVTMGSDIGYTPGHVKAKMHKWGQPALDNLLYLFDGGDKVKSKEQVDRLVKKGVFVIEPPSFISGRTIRNALVIIDEAHYFSREQMKMLMTRCGEGTKLVIAGDPSQVMETMNERKSFLTPSSNGLVHVIDKLPGHPHYAHITIPDTSVKRGPIALMARNI